MSLKNCFQDPSMSFPKILLHPTGKKFWGQWNPRPLPTCGTYFHWQMFLDVRCCRFTQTFKTRGQTGHSWTSESNQRRPLPLINLSAWCGAIVQIPEEKGGVQTILFHFYLTLNRRHHFLWKEMNFHLCKNATRDQKGMIIMKKNIASSLELPANWIEPISLEGSWSERLSRTPANSNYFSFSLGVQASLYFHFR